MQNNTNFKEKFKSWIRLRFTNEVEFISSKEAYNYANFGCQMNIDDRIKVCHATINSLIISESKSENRDWSEHGGFHCVYVIPDDVADYSDKIFTPFIERGFHIRRISHYITDINEPNLYLISWNQKNEK